MSPATIPSLLAALASLPDPRAARGRRHPLPALVALICVALLCGVRSQRGMADWLADQGATWRQRLGFTHAAGPSQSTLHRVLAQLDVLALETCLAQWSQQVLHSLPAERRPALALDGKRLRTSAQRGRIERRRLWTEPMLAEFSDFPGVAQALRLERRVVRQRTGEIRTEERFAVTSLAPAEASPAQLLQLWRGHWTIENRLHWVRDVTLGEDRCAVRSATAPQVLVALRNAVLAVLRATGVTNVARALRRFAIHPLEAAQLIGLPGL